MEERKITVGEVLELADRGVNPIYIRLYNSNYDNLGELLTTYRNRLVNGIDIRDFCDSYCYEVLLKKEEEESNE